MRILVTGGSGFLGSHLVDYINDKGYEVIIFDKIKSKYLKKNQKQIIGDILDTKLIENSVKNCDFVFHFAAMSNIEKSKIEPNQIINNNILGTQILLDACKKYKIKRFIFSSTIYVYSDLGSFYRLSKQTCESLIEEYSKEFINKLQYKFPELNILSSEFKYISTIENNKLINYGYKVYFLFIIHK